uniref:Peptidase M54 n=1 Tax=Desulfobacca acetoxidans TaxID=60893 RepID=A0A7V4G9G2_9BACT
MSQRLFLGLVPLGPVDPEILRSLRLALKKFFPLSVRILTPHPLPPHTFHLGRGQYHSNKILEYLVNEVNPRALRLLGITAVDLYIPILTFVFGEAQLGGRAAVVSLFRPRGDAGGIRPPKLVLLKRLIKLSLHELGHTFGLPHCRQEGCLMGFSYNLEKLDEKPLAFCRYCQVLLGDFFDELGLSHRKPRYAEIPLPGAASPVAGSGRKRRR